MHFNRRLQKIFVIVGLLLFAGCSESDIVPINQYDGPINRCTRDKDCIVGRCHEQKKICVVTPESEHHLIARVVPPRSTNVRSQNFVVPIEENASLILNLQGVVSVSDLDPGVSANVVFRDLNNTLPGQSPVMHVYDSDYSTAAMTLLPSVYDVHILPRNANGEQFPPRIFKNLTLDDDGHFKDKDGNEVIIEIPRDTELPYHRFSGRLLFKTPNGGTVPANDLQVTAVLPDTKTVVSTISHTRCRSQIDCGWYDLRATTGHRSYLLKIANPQEPFFPDITVPIDSIPSADDDLEDVILPRMTTPRQVSIRITARDADHAEAPPPRCRMHIAAVPSSNSEFERALDYWVVTNDNGMAERLPGFEGVYLYPGDYRINVFPVFSESNIAAQFGANRQETPITVALLEDQSSTATAEVTIPLEPRVNASSTVLYGDEPVPFSSFRLRDLDNSDAFSTFTVDSGSQGTVDSWLDNTVYYVVARPPSESRLAAGSGVWNVRQSSNNEFSISLQVPFVIEGNVHYEGVRTPSNFSGGTIEWYKVSGQSIFLVARSVIDRQGSFSTLLPPR